MRERFLPHFNGAELAQLGDAAVVNVSAGSLAISTDSFVVNPLEFPGGNIGTLAVNGTVNDVAMMGARPLWITVGFILEEGLPLLVLDRVIGGNGAGGDGGRRVDHHRRHEGGGAWEGGRDVHQYDGRRDHRSAFRPAPGPARAGDAVIVSGSSACTASRSWRRAKGSHSTLDLESDSAALTPLVDALRTALGRRSAPCATRRAAAWRAR